MTDMVARIIPREMVTGAKVVGFTKLDFPLGGIAAGNSQRSTVEVMAYSN